MLRRLAGGGTVSDGRGWRMAAGVYVPTLAKELLDNAKDTVPLKGIAVGDPCTDNVAQSDSMDGLWYGHKMGLVPDQLFDLLWNKCGARAPNEVALGGSSLRDKRNKSARGGNKKMRGPGPNFKPTPECKAAFRKFLVSTSKGFSQEWDR